MKLTAADSWAVQKNSDGLVTNDTASTIDNQSVEAHDGLMTTQATTAHKNNGKIVKGLWDCSRCGGLTVWVEHDGQMVLANAMLNMDGSNGFTAWDLHTCPQDQFVPEGYISLEDLEAEIGPIAEPVRMVGDGAAVQNAYEMGRAMVTTKITEPGFYIHADGRIARVEIAHKSGRPYAKLLDPKTGGYSYTKGLIFDVARNFERMTIENASAFGLEHGRCIVCWKTLSNLKSIARGIGPECAKRL